MKHLGPDGIAGPSGNVLIFFMQALFLDVVVVLNTNIRNHGSGYINIYIYILSCLFVKYCQLQKYYTYFI